MYFKLSSAFIFSLLSLISVVSVKAQQTTLPFVEGFENEDASLRWTFVQPTSRHKWYIGDATAAMDSNSMYVSADRGNTPGYTNSAKGIAAYTTLTLPAGFYTVSFDYSLVGETDANGKGLDSLYVYWVTDPNEKIIETNGDRPKSLETYRQQIINKDDLQGASLWHNTRFTARVRGANTPVRLLFYWVNNSANIVPPGVCIDNVQVMSENDPCPEPANFNASLTNGATLSWDKTSAHHYQLIYKNNSTGYQATIDSVTDIPFSLGTLDKGIYSFWLRGICGTDTSAWATYLNHIIAVSTDKCLNFIDIHNTDVVECRYGKRFEPARTNVGCMDFGYKSEDSQHTVHYQQGERDPKVPELLTIAPGELASVRLGNWRGKSEAECITYKLTVDSKFPILVIKYAAVLENIGHNGQDFAQPRFIIRVTDQRGLVLDKECLNIEYLTGSPTLPPGWNRIVTGSGQVGNEDRDFYIEWKDWTTMGINLSDYVGKTVNVYLETGDCTPSPGEGCFGYTYFSMDCVSDKLSGLTCGARAEELDTIWAPSGFRYEWVKKVDPAKVLFTDQFFVPAAGDTATYVCRMNFRDPGRETCSFSLEASLLPRYPAAKFSYIPCRTTINFIDSSYVYTANGVLDEKPLLYWDFGDGEYSDERDPIHTYAQPGKYEVVLRASIDEGMCDTLWADSVVVTADTLKVTETRYICQGERTLFGERYLKEPGIYTDSLYNRYGCDSISILDLRIYNTTADSVICGGDAIVFEGETLTLEPGVHELVYKNIKSYHGCDSILRLEVSDEIVISPLLPFCADADSAYFTISGGLADSVKIAIPNATPYVTCIVDNAFALPLNRTVKPGNYNTTFEFYNDYCGATERKLEFDINYPSDVLTQRWNDVVAVQNQANNGGYNLDGAVYQWFVDGVAVNGSSTSIYYAEDGSLDTAAQYSVRITTPDGVSVLTCPFSPTIADIADDDLNVAFIGKPSDPKVEVSAPVSDVTVSIFDAVGRRHSHILLPAGQSVIPLPVQPGVYVLHFTYPDGRTRNHKIVI